VSLVLGSETTPFPFTPPPLMVLFLPGAGYQVSRLGVPLTLPLEEPVFSGDVLESGGGGVWGETGGGGGGFFSNPPPLNWRGPSLAWIFPSSRSLSRGWCFAGLCDSPFALSGGVFIVLSPRLAGRTNHCN